MIHLQGRIGRVRGRPVGRKTESLIFYFGRPLTLPIRTLQQPCAACPSTDDRHGAAPCKRPSFMSVMESALSAGENHELICVRGRIR